MTKVSIIVPVYNTEKYLEKCLDSLINQTLKDIEIIVVNDGSTDNTQDIIDKYAKKYPKMIKSFVKKNGGPGDARNYGLKHANGEYIAFIDSDDYANPTMYEKLYKKANDGNFDLTVCDVKYIYPDKTKIVSSNISQDLKCKKEIKKLMLNIYPVVWNTLYKKDIFKKITFKKNVWFEDVEFLYRVFPYIDSIGVVNEALINYVQREGAITSTFDKRLQDYIDNWNGIVDFYKKNNFYDDYYRELEYCYVRYLYCTFVKQASNFTKKDYKAAVTIARENVYKYFPKYRHNLNFYKNLKGFYMLLFGKNLSDVFYFIKNRK